MLRRVSRTMATIVALSAVVVVSQAGAAGNPKLVVNGTDGTTAKFTVQDDGSILTNGGFYYDGATKRVGIGTTSPGIDLNVVRDITSGGTVMWLDGIGNVGSGPNIAIRTARGAQGALEPSQAGDIVGQVNFRGAHYTSLPGTPGTATFSIIRRGGFVSYATENYTPTGQGTNLSFVTTANGSTNPTEKLIVNGDGLVYIGQAMKDGNGAIIPAPTVSSANTKLAIVGDGLRITMTRTPSSSTAACNQGEISYDTNYLYVCTGTNAWKRAALSSW